MIKIHYNVDGEQFVQAGEASGDVKNVLKHLGIASGLIRKIAIVMYEAEINMVIHANGGIIDVELDTEKARIVLKDTGPGIANIDMAMQEGYSTATEEVRNLGFGAGMGLPNMKKNADFMHILSEPGLGTTVELIVNLT